MEILYVLPVKFKKCFFFILVLLYKEHSYNNNEQISLN